ncbi:hypothetical protein HHL17_23110 [Chitinophaga sp. G-6-1-13]|uniref:Uncharacterized protein n=1 Tax=Chitinophaga fulva TaxID=2728842 RepID=A0A848GWS0_9BACT|nr:hypothetical protein [Chitinophaga fulva]NML40108.1 hypothetical protein [Chitinophaga fulva]
MDQTPFQVQPLRPASFLRKLFRQPVEENAVVEINNLLATRELGLITIADLQHITQKYKLDVFKAFALNMQEFYVVYFHFALHRGKPDLDKELVCLQQLLQLPDEHVLPFHQQIGEPYFRQAVQDAIKDGMYSPADQVKLASLAKTLRLPHDLTDMTSQKLREEALHKRLASVIKSKRLSPTMKMDLLTFAKNLGIDLLKDTEVKKQLSDFEKWWELENSPLPVLRAMIDLTRNELCHFEMDRVCWYEDRVIRRGVSVPTLIKKGTACLTDKQLIFINEEGTSKIRLEKILRLVHNANGIEIIKDSGRNPTLYLGDETEPFYIILKQLINQNKQGSNL